MKQRQITFVPVALFLVLSSGILPSPSWSREEPLDPDLIRKVEGFEVELLRAAKPGEDSWISLSLDDRDRIILGLDKVGVARLTLVPNGEAKFERIESTLKHCRGVLFAHDSIYVNSTDSRLLIRLTDQDKDDTFETSNKLISFDYRSRYGHGANQMRLGPDGKIYIVIGNDVSFPVNTVSTSAYTDPRNDWLLPEQRDLGQDSRVGYILRMNPDGSQQEIIAGGFRNPVDMDFDPHGEMFTFDADMEWDIGAPWYRPIRINHVVSGGDYGWRWNTGKWPTYFPDTLPSNLDVGMGSPTGVVFGTSSQFPAKYRNALFIADWQNGMILAAFPKANGASYAFSYQSFLAGAPLNVCDMEFGSDGKLYFITGGRGSQSALYRVSWNGKTKATSNDNLRVGDYPPLSQLHKLRRKLEALHKNPDSKAIDEIWECLGHTDPWIRHAARVALEKLPVTTWEQRALREQNLKTAIESLVALVRKKSTTTSKQQAFRQAVVASLQKLVDQIDADKQADIHHLLGLVRICELLFSRHGGPSDEMAVTLFHDFTRFFPSSSEVLNRETCELLVFLGGKGNLSNDKSWRAFRNQAFSLLNAEDQSQETQIHLARKIAHIAQPWPKAHLESYAKWLGRANRFRGGHLLPKTIVQMRTDFETAMAKSSLDEDLKREITNELQKLLKTPKSTGQIHQREFVRSWSLAELKKFEFAKGNIKRGREIFLQAQCASCHRKGEIGSLIGPDLTNVAGRYNRSALLESIIEPSRQIDPKYALSSYATIDGKIHTGRVHGVNATTLTLEIDPILQTTIAIKREDIESTRPSKTSPMPTGLLNYFQKDEIVDLMAFLLNQ